MVVPNPAGGIGDIVVRAVVTKVAANWGQPIVVEAKPGTNGSIGTDSVAKSAADGYTWLLAIAASRRNAQFPEVPTVAEADYSDAQVVSWYAIVVPAKTPRDIVARINQEIGKALVDPEVVKRLDNAGATVAAPMTPEGLDAHLQSEVARWAAFFKNVKIDSQ